MKRLFVMIMAVILFLSACGTTEKTTKNVQTPEKTTQQDKTTTNKKASENNQGNNNQASTKQSNQTTAAEKVATNKPLYRVDPKTWSIVPIDPKANKKVVLITIDDAPNKHALEMAKTLKSLDVSAIFFVNGIYLNGDEKAKVLKQISDMGFMIGNHTNTHPYLRKLTPAKQLEEIRTVTSRVNQVLGKKPVFFRAPFGENTDTTKKEAADEKMLLMNWSYGYDWLKQYENKEALTKIMLEKSYNGAILLMHDRPWTAEALRDIVLGLQKKGYKMVDPRDIQTP